MDREALRLLLAQGESVEQIAHRFGRHPSTVSYWMRKHGLEAVNRDRHAARGPIDRERLQELIAAGLSITELAFELDRSKATIRHWLSKYGLRTLQAQRRERRVAALRAAASTAGELPDRLALTCRVHGDTVFIREHSGYFRCRARRSEAVMSHGRRLKELLVREAGGRCMLCGYDRLPRALAFHHLDPGMKEFALSQKGVTLSLDALRAEARKCVLLCSNCHAEVESGAVALPDTLRKAESEQRI